jgi:uridine kinase
MKTPFVVTINAVGGGGKTALTQLLHDSLPNSELLAFDDHGEPSVEPGDWHDWLQRGADILEFDFPVFAQAVVEALARRSSDYLILDYPFGREHWRLRDVINLSVYIDTPLDVALARRLLRDHEAGNGVSAEDAPQAFRRHTRHYLRGDRELFVYHSELHRATCDLVLDGSRSLEELRDELLDHLTDLGTREL